MFIGVTKLRLDMKNARIAYVANVRMPTEKAHGIAITGQCDAFARLGAKIELVVPDRKNEIEMDTFSYYDLGDTFGVSRLPCLDLVRFGKAGFLVETLTFSVSALFYLRRSKAKIIYTRDEIVAFFLLFALRKPVVVELHQKKKNTIWMRYVLSRARGIVCISESLRSYYVKQFNLSQERVIVEPSAVDGRRFLQMQDKNTARANLNLPKDAFLVGYIGSISAMGVEKGVAEVLGVFRLVCKEIPRAKLLVVGGSTSEIKQLRTIANTNFGLNRDACIFRGRVKHAKVPEYLVASDVLMIHYKEDSPFHSPLKLYEYLASGTPVVACKTIELNKALKAGVAKIIEQCNPQSFCDAIVEIEKNDTWKGSATKAQKLVVLEYTWEARARRLFELVIK